MKLSVIVVTYKRPDMLSQCLSAIYAQQGLPPSYEILLIDNGGDAVVADPPSPGIELRMIKPGENLWATGGRNLGIELARGEYLFFVDDDALWHAPDDMARLLAHLERDAYCGAASGICLRPDGSIAVGELPHPNKAVLLGARQPMEIPYFYTMGVAVRADVAKEIGGYPQRYLIYSEEFDLSYQIINKGYYLLFDPEIAIYHYKALGGRTIVNHKLWHRLALNKIQVAYRLLPHPYPLTTFVFWSLGVFQKTRSVATVFKVWSDLWKLRQTLREERLPMRPDRVQYLKSIGGRLLY